MMQIELFKDPNSEIWMPFVEGHLHFEMYEFLVYRYNWPKRIRESMRPVGGSSLRNIAYDLKQFIEGLAANKISITSASYKSIESLLNTQQKTYDWNNETYNRKYLRCREFYDFLSMRGISHNAIFPNRRSNFQERISYGHMDNHGERRRFANTIDDGLKRTEALDNYADRVISMEQYGDLYAKLHNIDPVYAVFAQTLMQTCLRISNTCQIPLSRTKNNPGWLLWPEFKALDKEFLQFFHIAKGKKPRWSYVWPVTIKAIYEDYIHPYYSARKELYLDRYCRRKNASLQQGYVELPKEILWLTANGVPVKPYMVEEAFRQTGMAVRPHDLRHTGATHLLWNYCQIKGIEPDERLAGQFQSFLQFQLGHVDIDTTRYYIRTLNRKRAQIIVPFALPSKQIKEELDSYLPPEAVELLEMHTFFSGKPT